MDDGGGIRAAATHSAEQPDDDRGGEGDRDLVQVAGAVDVGAHAAAPLAAGEEAAAQADIRDVFSAETIVETLDAMILVQTEAASMWKAGRRDGLLEAVRQVAQGATDMLEALKSGRPYKFDEAVKNARAACYHAQAQANQWCLEVRTG